MTEPWDVCLWACCASLYPVSSLVIFSDLKKLFKPLTFRKVSTRNVFDFKVLCSGEIISGMCHNDKMSWEWGRGNALRLSWSYETGSVLIILNLSCFIVTKSRNVSPWELMSINKPLCVCVCVCVCVKSFMNFLSRPRAISPHSFHPVHTLLSPNTRFFFFYQWLVWSIPWSFPSSLMGKGTRLEILPMSHPTWIWVW